MSNDYIYDIETYINMFSCGIVSVETGRRWIFEVSDRVNHCAEFITFLNNLSMTRSRLFGFNNESFDWPVCEYLINVFNSQGYFVAKDAYDKAQLIIGADHNQRFQQMVWENQRSVIQGDLFKIHHFNNLSRSTSLKKLEINMRSMNVVDLPYSPHIDLDNDQKDEVIAYMCHDVNETLKFYRHSKNDIDFRDSLKLQYPQLGDVLNYSATKIGTKFFEMKIEEKRPGSCYEKINHRKQPRQTHRPQIHLKDVVLPYVKFNSSEFNAILHTIDNTTITDIKGAFDDLKVNYDGIDFKFGLGGIHASVDGTSVYNDDEHDIIDVDVASYYPNIAISNGFYPEHLSSDFCEIYEELYYQRRSFPKGSSENEMLKLALNGVYGNSGDKYSSFYDTMYMLKTTINGQLLLCMLSEWLVDRAGAKIIQVNTDGVTSVAPKANRKLFEGVCKDWENLTSLTLEDADYQEMHVRDVNNYVAKTISGKIKRIGSYAYETANENPATREKPWHKSHDCLVVAKAVEKYLLDKTPLADSILENDDAFDFMLCAKADRRSRLKMEDGEPVQRTTRYYVSTDGKALQKVMPPLKGKDEERTFAVEKGWRVNICNDARDFSWNNVNYLYYIEKAKKLIELEGLR